MPLSDLTDEQQAAFRARLAQSGIDPGDVVAYVGPDTHPGQLVASPDPARSTIPPHVMHVANVDELKALTGIPDAHYETGVMEEHHETPEQWPADRVLTGKADCSPADLAAIHHAHV